MSYYDSQRRQNEKYLSNLFIIITKFIGDLLIRYSKPYIHRVSDDRPALAYLMVKRVYGQYKGVCNVT